jgi:hypothetical protein
MQKPVVFGMEQWDDPRPRARPDPFAGLWDAQIRPMLEAQPGLWPITLLKEMQRRRPDHDRDRLRWPFRRVRPSSAMGGFIASLRYDDERTHLPLSER